MGRYCQQSNKINLTHTETNSNFPSLIKYLFVICLKSSEKSIQESFEDVSSDCTNVLILSVLSASYCPSTPVKSITLEQL